jgi:hypothetical protein
MSVGDFFFGEPGALRELALRGLRVGVIVELRRRLVTKTKGIFEVGTIMRIVSVREDGRMTLEGLKCNRVSDGFKLGDRRIVGPVDWMDVRMMPREESKA